MAVKTQVNTDSAQTITNKTLTAPVINGGVCGADPTTPLGICTKQYAESLLFVVFPTGGMLPYAGANPPSGWLLCDGSAVSRTTYANLFSVCGVTYGAGNGTSTFNLPDKRGRGSIGSGTGSGLTNRIRGTKIGTENETAPLPLHTHSYSKDAFSSAIFAQGGQTALTGVSGSTSQTTGSAGTGGTHNNMQPSEVDTWIIKT